MAHHTIYTPQRDNVWHSEWRFHTAQEVSTEIIALHDPERAKRRIFEFLSRNGRDDAFASWHDASMHIPMTDALEAEYPHFFEWTEEYRALRYSRMDIQCALTRDRFALLLGLLIENPVLDAIVSYTGLDEGLVEQLAAALPLMRKLEWLAIFRTRTENMWKLIPEGQSTLERIAFGSCDMTHRVVKLIADRLRVNTSINRMGLSDCMLTDVDVRVLLGALGDDQPAGARINTSLMDLFIANNDDLLTPGTLERLNAFMAARRRA